MLVTTGKGSAAEHVVLAVFDSYGRDVYRLDPMGNESLSEYDANGNLVGWTFLGEVCDVPGSAGNVRLAEEHHAYDAMDRLLQTTREHFDPATQAPIGDGQSVQAWTWTDHSERASATDDNGNTRTMEFDTVGRLRRTVDAKGNWRRLTYDGNDNVVQRLELEISDVDGSMAAFATTCVYDEVDRLVSETDPVGNQTRLGYDSKSNLTRIEDGLGNVTVRTFDGLGRLLGSDREMTDTGVGGGAVIGAVGKDWTWDASSRLTSQTDPEGNVTLYAYDALDRRTLVTRADGTSESRAFDEHGNEVFREDANGTEVTSTYDENDRLSGRTVVPGTGVSTDTSFETWKFDGLGRLVHAEDDDALVARAWDSLGLLTSESQDGRSFSFSHDGVGNALEIVYPGGKAVSFAYDALNRIQAITNEGAAAGYEYFGPARVERRVTGANVVTSTRTYDGARRVSGVKHVAITTTLDDRSLTWDGVWNKASSMDHVAGTQAFYTYDSQYRLVQGRVEDGGGTTLRQTDYSFDDAGNRTSVAGGACPGAYTMDPTMPDPADEQVNQYTSTPCWGCIGYDDNGSEILRNTQYAMERDWRDRIVVHEDLVGMTTTTYAHDPLGRRVRKTDGGGTTEFLYVGPFVVEERGGGAVSATYVRGPGGELVERTLEPAGTVNYYLCDDLGSVRVVTDAAGNVAERYEYDDFGAPEVYSPGGAQLGASAIGNPWLFTGQYYDAESGFYLCGARHLDPVTGRFTSRDPLGMWGDPTNTGVGATYVGNNPQTLVDTTGFYSARATCGGGAWPGELHVYYERIDCGTDTRIPNSLCNAKIGAGRALREYRRWSGLVLEGMPGNPYGRVFAQVAQARFLGWFGAENGRVDPQQMFRIGHTLTEVWEPFEKGLEIPIECEGSCDRANAYVAPYDCSIHLCPPWFSLNTNNRRGGVLLHEMAHEYGGLPQDTFYYQNSNSPQGPILPEGGRLVLPGIPYTSRVLVQNADTYEEFYFALFVSPN